MKTSIFKRSLSMLMALPLCLSAFVSIGTPTAYAANTKAEVFVISFAPEVMGLSQQSTAVESRFSPALLAYSCA